LGDKLAFLFPHCVSFYQLAQFMPDVGETLNQQKIDQYG
jgi:hypothetical protein